MRYNMGVSTAQYAIIIALIGVAISGVFLAFGNTINDQFASMNTLFTDNNAAVQENAKQNEIAKSSIVAGSLGGTISAPQEDCTGGLCTIDYGDFILSGVPENYKDFIETQGTSGGTDLLSSLIDQMADHLEEIGETEASAEYRQLANLGHAMADFNEAIEDVADSCKPAFSSSSMKGSTCFRDEIYTSHNSITVPDNLKDILTNTSDYKLGNLLFGGVLLGEAKKEYLNKCIDGVCNENYLNKMSTYPSYAMVSIFEKIVSNPNYSEGLKNITKELYRDINDLAYQQVLNSKVLLENVHHLDGTPYNISEYDPVTGELLRENVINISDKNYDNLIKPQTSITNDLNSALICTTSSNHDSNNNCRSHKGNGDGNGH